MTNGAAVLRFMTLGLLTGLAVSGCSEIIMFKDVADGSAAQVRFTETTRASAFGSIHEVNAQKCDEPVVMGTIGSPRWVRPPSSIGSTLKKLVKSDTETPDTWVIEHHVKPDVAQTFVYYPYSIPKTAESKNVCSVRVTFTPQSHAQYEVDFAVRGSKCSASVVRLTKDEARDAELRQPVEALINDPKAGCLARE